MSDPMLTQPAAVLITRGSVLLKKEAAAALVGSPLDAQVSHAESEMAEMEARLVNHVENLREETFD